MTITGHIRVRLGWKQIKINPNVPLSHICFICYYYMLYTDLNCMIPHGGAESAFWSFTFIPYWISNLIKRYKNALIIGHKDTKNQCHNFYDQNFILDFRRNEQILLSHVK